MVYRAIQAMPRGRCCVATCLLEVDQKGTAPVHGQGARALKGIVRASERAVLYWLVQSCHRMLRGAGIRRYSYISEMCSECYIQ